MPVSDDALQLSYAIWASEQTEQTKQTILMQRSMCIDCFCDKHACETEDIPEQGDCVLISTFVQLKRVHNPSIINNYREQLIRLERLNPTHYFHVSSFGGQFVSNADKKKMLKRHTRNVVIPGTMTEDVEFQAIANKESAIVSLYCILVATNVELDVQVFLPKSGTASHCCLNFLLLLTEHPVGSHVQPLYFGSPYQSSPRSMESDALINQLSTQPTQSHVARQIVVDLESAVITDGVIMLHTVERNDLPLCLCEAVINELMTQPSQSQSSPRSMESDALINQLSTQPTQSHVARQIVVDLESAVITDVVIMLHTVERNDLPLCLCKAVINELMTQPSQSQPARPVEDTESKSITDDVVFMHAIKCVDLPRCSVDTALHTGQYVTRSAAKQRLISLPCIMALVSALLFLMANFNSAMYLFRASVLVFESSGVIGDNTSYDFARKYYLPSTTNLTTILASAISGVTGDQTSYLAPYCVADFNEMQPSVAGSFSFLIGCRVGEAKIPGPGRSRAASSTANSTAIRQARLSAAQADCATTAADAHVVVPMMPLVPAAPPEKPYSGERNIPGRTRAASSNKSAFAIRQARLLAAQADCATTAADVEVVAPMMPLVPAVPPENPFHASADTATTAGLQAASDYFAVSNISRQTCACCNERCKTRSIKTVKAEGQWLDRLKNRLNWSHTNYGVNDVTKAYYSAPINAIHLQGLPLAPCGIVVEMDGSATVRAPLTCNANVFPTICW